MAALAPDHLVDLLFNTRRVDVGAAALEDLALLLVLGDLELLLLNLLLVLFLLCLRNLDLFFYRQVATLLVFFLGFNVLQQVRVVGRRGLWKRSHWRDYWS